MQGRIEIEIKCKNTKEAKAMADALHEGERQESRSEASLSVEGSKVLITITANDIVALRAVGNSYLRHIQAISGLNEVE